LAHFSDAYEARRTELVSDRPGLSAVDRQSKHGKTRGLMAFI